MKKQTLYRELAKDYDLIYIDKEYNKEVQSIFKLITKYKKSKGKELLDVACGTGKHLNYLKSRFTCTGIDLNQSILNIAIKNVKNANFKKANMINFRLKRRFDVITCLFSSIGYVKTQEKLRKTIINFSKHLKNGGVVFIEPWFTKATYFPGTPHMSTYQDNDIKIARLSVSKVKDNISLVDLHYLIAERNKEVKHFSDRNELGLFEINETLDIMKKAGLKSKFLKNGLRKDRGDRGLFVGIKT